MKSRSAVVVVIVVVLLVIGAFVVYANPNLASALGLQHAPVQQSTVASSTRRFAGDHGDFAVGSIESLNDSGFTITMQDGTTKNITTTATTTFQDSDNASSTSSTITSDDLSVGEPVRVMGTTESDGSVAASRVILQ